MSSLPPSPRIELDSFERDQRLTSSPNALVIEFRQRGCWVRDINLSTPLRKSVRAHLLPLAVSSHSFRRLSKGSSSEMTKKISRNWKARPFLEDAFNLHTMTTNVFWLYILLKLLCFLCHKMISESNVCTRFLMCKDGLLLLPTFPHSTSSYNYYQRHKGKDRSALSWGCNFTNNTRSGVTTWTVRKSWTATVRNAR